MPQDAARAGDPGAGHAEPGAVRDAAAAQPGQPAEADQADGFQPREDLLDLPGYRLKHTLRGHSRAVTSVKFSQDGARVASASADGTARVWDAASGTQALTLQGHEQGLSDMCWRGDGSLLATASDDHTLKLWDAQSGACLSTLRGHTHAVFSCSFSAAGNMLVSASFDETLRVWDVRTGQVIRAIPAHSDPLTGAAFNGHARTPLIASSSFDGLSRVWEANTGKCIATLQEPANLPMSSIRFTPNSRFLLVGTLGSKLYLWDHEANRIKKTYTGHKCRAQCLHAALTTRDQETGPLVLSGSEDHHVYAWHLNSREIVGVLRGRARPEDPGDGHCDVVLAVDASPAAPAIASGAAERDCTIKLWEASA